MYDVLRDVGAGGGGGGGGGRRQGVGGEREGVGSEAGADSLLPIVSSQRERFKQRNMELEAVRRERRREGRGERRREGEGERARGGKGSGK